MKNPWFKFNPTHWRGDEQLRNCSIAARGLWIEVLCLMHRATPYGHLLINCEVPTDTQLAIQTGMPIDQLIALRDELEKNGVFSRTGKGVIFSRRMVDDEKKSRILTKNGKNGGNPNLCKDKGKTPLVNQEDKPRDKPQDKPKNLEDRKKEYWWEGKTIRLMRKDYEAMFAEYSQAGGTDEQFMAWLLNRDNWFNGPESSPSIRANWFHSTWAAIKKLNNRDQT